jgi:uncharacterized protein (DUF885 family)
MTTSRDVADQYLAREAELDPISATFKGLLGHDRELTDFSPDGIAARTESARQARDGLHAATVSDPDERRCRDLLAERLDVRLALDDQGEPYRCLNILHSPVQVPRQVFDLMPRESDEDWEIIADRMERIPETLAGLEITLLEGLRRKLVAARRQAEACATQAATWAGSGVAAPFFADLVGSYGREPTLRRRLDDAAERATAAYGALATFLQTSYAPEAGEIDAVGPERYALAARSALGASIDPAEVYAWGWQELYRLEADMAATAERIVPGASVAEVERVLESDPARSIEGVAEFRQWLQDLMDATIASLAGVHFDIPAPVQRVEAMIAPPGGAAAMYYTGPSEDFTRPGRTWYPTLGRTRFPLWGEVSIAYHEGVPGHHLQVAQVRYLGERLSAYQRATFVSGHGEGWALYAERLMDELGYLDNPDYRLGMLRAQAMRAVRVVVDIGMHLSLTIPTGEAFHPGERWTPELGSDFVSQRSHFPADFMASEIIRYLGVPGQAISYKVGERVWLEARDQQQRRLGDDFDLKAFHAHALDLGPLGLDQLRAELAGPPV